jgi:hypothetical protein
LGPGLGRVRVRSVCDHLARVEARHEVAALTQYVAHDIVPLLVTHQGVDFVLAARLVLLHGVARLVRAWARARARARARIGVGVWARVGVGARVGVP